MGMGDGSRGAGDAIAVVPEVVGHLARGVVGTVSGALPDSGPAVKSATGGGMS
ncbi:MAG: hypothetical protein J7M16_01645 [Anaerolineae bacterium]|nr:hypothetical protein [Anaerolineae bacterium]